MKISSGANVPRDLLNGRGRRLAVLVSRFNSSITGRLLRECQKTLRAHGAREKDVHVRWLPGSFELPLAAQTLARTRRYHAVIALGCILRGETPHDRYIAQAVAQGLQQASLNTGVPVIFGVLTPLTLAQAKARAGIGPRNKGREAALAALEMACVMKQMKNAE